MKFEEIRCPVKTCYGWVSSVDDFWGCGSCGTVWNNLESLFSEIELIISKYSYRGQVYTKSGTMYLPVDLDDEPEDYEEMVFAEWEEN